MAYYWFDWDDFSGQIDGQGSMHGLSDDRGRLFGEPGARIVVRPKRRPIGFAVPKRTPR